MNTSLKVVCVALLLALGVSVGFGWGTVTHAYLANHLGVKNGPLNQNEIYGATLPDLLGYNFYSESALTADFLLHTSPDVLWGLYKAAPSAESRAVFYGAFTHNNINDPKHANMRGADWFAHGVYPGDQKGWVIRQGLKLVSDPRISSYIATIVPPEALPAFAPVVGHTLIETAVDILVKRQLDPGIGGVLYEAAMNRSPEVGGILTAVLGGVYDSIGIFESAYQTSMMEYGGLFTLPEDQIIGIISYQTAGVAASYLHYVLGVDPLVPIDPDKIAEFIGIAIRQVAPVYKLELLATWIKVAVDMRNGPPPAGPVFAFCREDAMREDLAGFNVPTETPTDYALDQNFPNPFNPTTNISYAVPSDSRVTLKVYNSIGQEVATLVDESLTAGRYVAAWDAKGLASGIYFYRMQAGSTVLTNKMTLLK